MTTGSYVPHVDFFKSLSDIGDTFVENREKARDEAILAGPNAPKPVSFVDRLLGAVSRETPKPAIAPESAAPAGVAPTGEVANYIRQAALSRGIDPETAVRVAASEGLKTYTGDSGSSFGPFQLHYGGVAPGGNAVGGLGDEFTRTTGLNARDPSTWKQQVDFSLDQAAKGGWGPWHGAANVGIGERQGIGAAPGQPVQVADASGRIPAPVGAEPSPAPASAPAPAQSGAAQDEVAVALKGFPAGLQTPESINYAMLHGGKYVRAIATQANNVYVQALARKLAREQHQEDVSVRREDAAAREKARQEDVQFRREERAANEKARQAEIDLKRQERVDAGEKQTGEQANAATFSTRMHEADKIISDPAIYSVGLGVSGGAREAVKDLPLVGTALSGAGAKGEAFQKYDQARRDFVNATLRKESGAAINASEFANAEKQYFPVPGDKPGVIAQKAKNRATAIDTIAAGGNNTFRKAFAEKRAAHSGAPTVGVVEDGYRFKGGSPSNPASWERVQ